MAGLIERVGLADAARLVGMKPDDIVRIDGALGSALPSDFGVSISRVVRDAEKARESLLATISTLDPTTEVRLVIGRQRAATILPEKIPDELMGEAAQAGLKAILSLRKHRGK